MPKYKVGDIIQENSDWSDKFWLWKIEAIGYRNWHYKMRLLSDTHPKAHKNSWGWFEAQRIDNNMLWIQHIEESIEPTVSYHTCTWTDPGFGDVLWCTHNGCNRTKRKW